MEINANIHESNSYMLEVVQKVFSPQLTQIYTNVCTKSSDTVYESCRNRIHSTNLSSNNNCMHPVKSQGVYRA